MWILIFPLILQTYQLDWVKHFDNGQDDAGFGISLDQANYIWVVGMSFTGNENYRIIKLDTSGNFILTWEENNGGRDIAYDVTVDPFNYIIVTGTSKISSVSNGYTLQYNSSGNIQWQDTLPEAILNSVAADNNGNIFVVGETAGDTSGNFITVKYASDGTLLWRRTFDNGDFDYANGVAVDLNNNIVVSGYSMISGDDDIFTVKYDPSGNIIWADSLDIGSYENALDITVDSFNNIIVSGAYLNPQDWLFDGLLIKYDQNGNLLWQRTYDISGMAIFFSGVEVNSSGEIFVTGTIMSNFIRDAYVAKTSVSGDILWSDTLDLGGYEYGSDIAIESNDVFYIIGYDSLPGDSSWNIVIARYTPSFKISEDIKGVVSLQFPFRIKIKDNQIYIQYLYFGAGKIYIYEVTGRRLLTKTLSSNLKGTYINFSSFSSGIYFLRLKTEEQLWHKKILFLK